MTARTRRRERGGLSGDAVVWARRNVQALIALVVLAGLVVLGQRWAMWLGFGMCLAAAVAFFVTLDPLHPPQRRGSADPAQRRRHGPDPDPPGRSRRN